MLGGIDVISTEINFIGNLVGSYTDLCELMVLAAQGRVVLHTEKYPLDRFQDALDDLEAGTRARSGSGDPGPVTALSRRTCR